MEWIEDDQKLFKLVATNKPAAEAVIAALRKTEAERNALALRVVGMRELLEKISHAAAVLVSEQFGNLEPEDSPACVNNLDALIDPCRASVDLPESEAEARVKAWREKSELLDWLDKRRPSLAFGGSENRDKFPRGSWGIYWTNKDKECESVEAQSIVDALRAAKEGSDAGK